MTIEGAIAELQNLIKADDVPFYYTGAIQKVIETIIDECKPKVGRWIKLDETETLNESYTCSQCGYRKWVSKVRFLYEPKLVLNYCPNCGAKMERSE